jgi:ectoine hydroxylase-related dioxygenase (phytanoyl-CoA dioxygenase family)
MVSRLVRCPANWFAAAAHRLDRRNERLNSEASTTRLQERLAPLAERFQRDGFVVVADLLTDEELDRYGAATDRAVARRKRFDHRALAEKSAYEQSFIQCMNLWEDNEDVRPLTFHQRIGEAAATLVRVQRLRLWHDQALYKEAGGRETEPHQDQPYWPIRETDTITAWIAFDGSTLESGAMAYLPGSHRVGLRKFVNIFAADGSVEILKRPEVKDIEPVFVEVPRGAVAFHHGLTVHLAKPNRTDRTRRVHTMIYFRDGSTRGNDHPHPSVDRAGIAVGHAIDSDVTPIAWPRPEGDLPTVPSHMPGWGQHPVPGVSGVFPEREPDTAGAADRSNRST